MIVMEEGYKKSKSTINQLQILGFGIVKVSYQETKNSIQVLYSKGVDLPLIQNVIELCKNDLNMKEQGNSIIPIDEYTLFLHYFQNKGSKIVLIYMDSKDNNMSYSQLYLLTKQIQNHFRLNASIIEIKSLCDSAIGIPKTEGVIGIFFITASGSLLVSKISKERSTISRSDVHIGGFISALYSFSKEIIRQDEGAKLKEINFGNQRFYLITKSNVIVSFLVKNLDPLLKRYMYSIVDEFVDEFQEQLKDFNGDITPFSKFEEKIDQFFII